MIFDLMPADGEEAQREPRRADGRGAGRLRGPAPHLRGGRAPGPGRRRAARSRPAPRQCAEWSAPGTGFYRGLAERTGADRGAAGRAGSGRRGRQRGDRRVRPVPRGRVAAAGAGARRGRPGPLRARLARTSSARRSTWTRRTPGAGPRSSGSRRRWRGWPRQIVPGGTLADAVDRARRRSGRGGSPAGRTCGPGCRSSPTAPSPS